ncbi:MAG: hypothetical protein JWO25_1389 [Alphaproteobacteria bacterium]|nr:hypothetical protein [Alphaproteobacteria bacterium]
MNKALLLAAAAGTFLISSAPPRSSGPVADGVGYPPCSRSVRDRCIQLHERGVATAKNLAMNSDDGPRGEGPGPRDRYAEGPPPRDMMPHGMMPHGRNMDGRMDGTPEMDSVVGPPPPEPAMRMAMNDYPPCAGGMDDRCIERHVLVRQHARMLRIGERG